VETTAATGNEEISTPMKTIAIGNNSDDSTTTMSTTQLQEQEELQHQTIIEKAAQRLADLDTGYDKLDRCEILLMEEYRRVVEEEACLRRALQKATESGREMLSREKKEKDDLAVQRLEAALFDDDDEDSSDEGEDIDGDDFMGNSSQNGDAPFADGDV